MDLDVLKSLVAVAETGSFSRAATSLCVSQSAVSKRIRQLEETLELTLLDRSGAVLQLTTAGKIVCKNAKTMLVLCRSCYEELDALRQHTKLSFCCTPSYGITYVPKIVRTFMEHNPAVTNFSCSFANIEKIMEGLQNGSFHLAVVEHCDLIQFKGRVLERLADDTMVLVGAPALGVSYPSTTIDDLLAFNVCLRTTGCCSRLVFDMKMAAMGRSLDDFKAVVTYDDVNTILTSVLAGDGISYLARHLVQGFIDEGRLLAFPLPGFEQPLYRSLVVGPGFMPTSAADDLIRIIKELSV